MKISFIGLGNMGGEIAKNILASGFDLTVWNRSAAKAEAFKGTAARIASSPADAVADADVVITSLMDDASILDMVAGEGGLLGTMKPGATHLCVTTISPNCAVQLGQLHADHGTRYVSGPVAGRPEQAKDAALTTLLSGPSDAVEPVKAICASYSNQVVHVGEGVSSANIVKLGVNYMAVSVIEVLSEIYAMVEANGVDSSFLAKMFSEQTFAHPALRMYARKIQSRAFEGHAGFAMTAGLKDVRLMIETAKSKGVDADVARVIEGKMMQAVNSGMGDKDWSSIYEITRARAGLA